VCGGSETVWIWFPSILEVAAVDALALARWQFAILTVYHFLFVPLTIGLSLLVAIMQTMWVRSGNLAYLRMTKFWGRLFLINFALGVVTGIVQEFQFGMNWSAYSRYVGDVFGAPLAIEGLLAFFLESTFLGLWIFGWGRLSKRLHLATIWLVAIGTQLSAYFILAANSWMQHPVGYVLNRATGRAELKNIFAVLTNSTLLVTFPHTIFASFLTAGMMVLGISGWHLLRERHAEVFARSARIALVVSFVSAVAVAFVGHAQAQVMTRQQPTKMAAAEALWSDEAPTGFSLFAVGDVEHGRNHVNLVVPHALSILATNTLNGEVKGINDVQAEEVARFGPGNYLPVVGVTYWTFRLMVGIGLLLGAFTFLGLVLLRYRRLERGRWFHRLALWGIGLPLLANTLGWVFTEMGRQPWVVYGLLRTALAAFTFVYGVLAAIDLWLMARWAKADPDELEGAEGAEPDSTLTMAY
jgi:cytochrome d ubiquinol oxidase subunit I